MKKSFFRNFDTRGRSLLRLLVVLLTISIDATQVEVDKQKEYASRGALVEALAILQHRQKDIRDYIQELKKALTECSLVAAGNEHTKESREKEVYIYHRDLRCMLFPAYIKELETLDTHIGSSIEEIIKEDPMENTVLEERVGYAFLTKDKIDAEAHIFTLVVDLDMMGCMLKSCEENDNCLLLNHEELKGIPVCKKEFQDQESLQGEIQSSRKKLILLKRSIADINAKLYATSRPVVERVFLDRLECFIA